MKNPNSYDSIRAIFEYYKDIHSMGVESEWVALGICNQVFMEPLEKEVFKCESKEVYDYFINTKDIHKSFQAITLLLFGAMVKLYYKFKQESQCNIYTSDFRVDRREQ